MNSYQKLVKINIQKINVASATMDKPRIDSEAFKERHKWLHSHLHFLCLKFIFSNIIKI